MIGPLLFAIIYFALLIFVVGCLLRNKIKTMEDFAMGGHSLSWPLVTFGLCLVPLGSGHTLSLWEASAGLGAAVVWWSIIVGGTVLPLLMLWYGPWLRDLKVETFPEVMDRLFGSNMRYLHAAVNVSSWTGIAPLKRWLPRRPSTACPAARWPTSPGASSWPSC
jgi:SSS family solute:Na+ symporter